MRYFRAQAEQKKQAEQAKKVEEYRRQRREQGLGEEEEEPAVPQQRQQPARQEEADDPARKIWEELFGPQEEEVRPEPRPYTMSRGPESEGRPSHGIPGHRHMPSEDLHKMPEKVLASSGTSPIPPGVNISEWAEMERRKARKRIEAELAASEADMARSEETKGIRVDLRKAVIYEAVLNAPYLGQHGKYSSPRG